MSESVSMALPEPMAVRGVKQDVFDKQVAFRADLEVAMPQLLAVLPKGVRGEALVSMALTAALDAPALLDCEPLSLVRATFKMAALGLRPGETCDIVPTKKGRANIAECWIRVKGVVDLAVRAKAIQWAKIVPIAEGDVWSFENEVLTHKPVASPRADGSNVTHMAALVILPSGERVWEVWPRERILEHRDRYAKGLTTETGATNMKSPWHRDPLPMWGKTVLKSLLRFARLSPEVTEAINAGDTSGEAPAFLGGGDPTEALRAGAGVLALGAGAADEAQTRMTLDEAEAVLLPGDKDAWGGHGGTPLGLLKPSLLARVKTWVEGDAERTARFGRVALACDIILGDREDAGEQAA